MSQLQTAPEDTRPVSKPLAAKKNGVQSLMVKVFEDENGDPVNAITKVTSAGIIQATMTRVPLSIKSKELYTMGGMVDRKWSNTANTLITASGYDKLNQFAGITMHQPETVLDDEGKIRPNPYFHREGGQLVGVRIRMMGLGRNAVGSIVLHDNTLLFDVRTYLAQDLWSKWTGRKSENTKKWGKAFPLGRVPKEIAADHEWLQVECPNGIVLCVNLTDKDVVNMMGEQLNRAKFAERLARTICKRNILKTFLGAVVPQAEMRDGKFYRWCVPIVSWPISDHELKDFGDLAERAKSGELVVDGDVIDVTATSETIDDPDDVESVVSDVVDETDGPQEEEPDAPAPGVAVANPGDDVTNFDDSVPQEEVDGHREAIRACRDKLPDDQFKRIMKQCGFNTLKEIAECGNSLSDADALRSLAEDAAIAARNLIGK